MSLAAQIISIDNAVAHFHKCTLYVIDMISLLFDIYFNINL